MKGEVNMKNANKIYYTAQELSEILGVSLTYSYKLIKKLNKSLEENGYITIPGRVSKAYFNEKFYGHGA